ncbi:hypothetical protein AWJ20_1115 [Sugiyamaella lignohabitans]|uniref:F-box domain-containing protein n=1 Tax=Sugiyamaella lignohabitans TaxID=796027 RepID=A0A167DF03_9ASCO|nr:uncharacterized protein AWJ20_1115 [Sugiyamaella lignohabitans]ANB12841.1 hypothetical protein AWJ20_1115 [Sugiyamaella lignohabitans]
MKTFIKRGDEYFLQGNYSNAIDSFTQAIQWGKKNGCSPRALFDVVERRAVAAEKAELFRNSMTDAKLLIKLIPTDPAGYLRCALLMVKMEKKYFQALEVLIEAKKVTRIKPSDPVAMKRWEKLQSVMDGHMQKLKQKTNFNQRQDPLAVFPAEVSYAIFQYLGTKEWLRLQSVSKSWHDYLANDHYLWATSIDFSQFKRKRHTAKNLERCLDKVFMVSPTISSPIRTLKYLRIGPFASYDAEKRSLELISRATSKYSGKSIEHLHLISGTSVRSISNFLPMQKLTLSFEGNSPSTERRIIYLDEFFGKNSANLQDIDLAAYTITHTESHEYPSLKTLKLKLAVFDFSMSSLSMKTFPNLENLSLTFNTLNSGDVSWLSSTFKNDKLRSLSISSGKPTRISATTNTEMPTEWPSHLSSLKLDRVEWPHLRDMAGYLNELETLELTSCKIHIKNIFTQFGCGQVLQRVILDHMDPVLNRDFKGSFFVNCPQLKQLSLFGNSFVNDSHIIETLLHCPLLREVDIGETAVSEDSVFQLVRRGVVKVGCQSVQMAIDSFPKLSSRATIYLQKLPM